MSLDWRALSGAYVSRRTLLKFMGTSGLLAAGCARGAPSPTAGPQPTAAPAASKIGGTLTAAWLLDKFDFLDPHRMNLGLQMEAMSNVFDGLTRLTAEVDVEGALAESWQVSEDGRTYTFRLRKGVKWHNGDDFTAEDVLFSYRRVLDKDFGSPHAGKLAPIESLESPDDSTVVIMLKEPFAPLLTTVTNFPGRALTPVSKRALEQMGNDQYNLTPVGTGPFRVAEHRPGQELVLERFGNYWQPGVPLLERVVIKLIPEEATINAALLAGDVDFVNHPPNQFVASLEKNPAFAVSRVAGTNWVGLQMHYTDHKAPFLADPRVRLALAKAVDRGTLIEKAYFGLAVPAYGVLNPAVKWAFRENKPHTQEFDQQEARRLLAEAGAQGIAVEIMTPPDGQRETEILAEMLRQVGVEVGLDVQEGAIYRRRRDEGEFMVIHSGSVVDPDPDESVWNFFHSQGPWNRLRYRNLRADELLVAQRRETDRAKRARVLADLEDVLTQDVAAGWTAHVEDVAAFNKNKVQGWVHVPELRPFHATWVAS
jgi:peptide/nickel transport system substrate-binding protein